MTMGKKENLFDRDRTHQGLPTYPKRNQNIEKIHAILQPSNPLVSQDKVRKPRVFTPLRETLTDIFQRLWAKGLLRPINGWNPKHSTSNFDLSKNCAYHSNIQGHDTEECAALRNKIQNMIEKGKIIVQQGRQNNNCNPSMANKSSFKEILQRCTLGT